MRGMNANTVHKFRNQGQNLSSDQERDKYQLASDGSMINSFHLNTKGNRNKTQETSKNQMLPYPDNSSETMLKKI